MVEQPEFPTLKQERVIVRRRRRTTVKPKEDEVEEQEPVQAESKKESAKMVKVRFHYSENEGETWTPLYQLKKYTLVDGEEYELPLSMVKEINENCKIAIRSNKKKAKDGTFQKTGRFMTRAYFEILG